MLMPIHLREIFRHEPPRFGEIFPDTSRWCQPAGHDGPRQIPKETLVLPTLCPSASQREPFRHGSCCI